MYRTKGIIRKKIIKKGKFSYDKYRIYSKPESKIERLQNEMKELREYIEEAFTDYNDINEDTRMQIELINQALAELQVKNKEQIRKERPRIGFIRAEGGV